MNGEAIYGTDYWNTFGEGPNEQKGGYMSEHDVKSEFTAQDIRFKHKGDKLYAIMLDWPSNGKINIKSLGKASEYGKDLEIKGVRLLGSDAKINFEVTDDGLSITEMGKKVGDFAHVFEITL